MTNMVAFSSSLTMTSREIAELTGKRHDHVLRDIRAMICQVHDLEDNPNPCYLEIQGVTFERDAHTKRVSMISLDKDHTLTLLTGYDAKARFKVMVRWQELESKALPQDYPAALRALADESERRAQVERELEASRPKIAFHDQVINAETLLDFAQAFSLLQGRTGQHFTRKTFLEFLRRHGVACQANAYANIGKDRFVPRKDYTGTWFVSELTARGGVEWLLRPMALAGIVALIEQDRMNPPPLRNALVSMRGAA